MRHVVIALTLSALAFPALAKDPPLPPPEAVYQAPGKDVTTLTRRALVCIPQNTSPGFVDAPAIISSDVAGGVIVANNAFEYDNKVIGLHVTSTGRTKLTFEARDGRFRISHANPEQTASGGGWAQPDNSSQRWMNKRLTEINDAIAECVSAGDSGDW